MKTAENKSTHSQQHTQTEHSSGEQEHERPFFSEPAPQQTPFFNPGATFWVQGKFIGEQTPFFSPSSTATIQRMPAFESEENRVQAKIAPGVTATTPQIQLADTEEQEPEEDTSTDTDLQPKLASNAVDPPEDVGESSEGLPFTQTKLTIGKPNDRYEREADAVANQVVAMPKQRANLTPGLQTKALSKNITKLAQRQVASVQPKRLQGLPKVQKQGDGNLKASSNVASRLSSTRGRGSNLDENTRGEMESNFGADFGNVRVHTGSEATQLSQDLGAKAFTHGSDIYFNQGQYNPNSSEGKHLLAHELTHTVQQGASLQRKVNISTSKAPNIQLLWGAAKRWAIRKFKKGLNWLAERTVPGYTLLNVVLGKNLITGDAVARSGVNLIRGYMRLSPVIGSILLSELEETESLPQAGKWVEGKVAEFGIDFDDIARRLELMWDEMSITKGVEGNIGIFKKHLGPVIGKIMAFSSVVMEKVKELRFEAALRLVGAGELLDALKKDPQAFKKAIDDPKTVLKQFMVGALKKGFANFKDNFITHFKGALLGWLFGKAAQMGVQMPKQFDIAGLFSLIAQVVGATYTQIRAMVVQRLGPKGEMIVDKLETTVTFIKDLVTKGPIVLWERVKDFLSNLKEMIFSKIATLVSTEIITAAVTKLLSMLNPAGAIVQLAMTLYRVIKFFIDNWETIKSVAMGILNSIGMVALNKIGPAAAFVEKILAQGMKLIIGFLARIFGLGGIVEKVKALIKKISDPVKKAIGKVIDWIVKQGKKLFGKVKKVAKDAKAKLFEWWKKRKKFKHGGASHTLFFEGSGSKAKMMMHSDKRALGDYYDKIYETYQKKSAETPPPNIEVKKAIEKLKMNLDEYNRLKQEGEKHKEGTPIYFQWNTEFGTKLSKLSGNITTALAKIPGDYGDENLAEVGSKARPRSTNIQYPKKHRTSAWSEGQNDSKALLLNRGKDFGQLRSDSSDGEVAEIQYLSFNLGSNHGSKGLANSALMKKMKEFRGISVVPGHLINHHLGGPGNENDNIAPITGSCNTRMSNAFEEHAKKMVLKKNQVIHYKVEVEWGSHSQLTNTYKIDTLMPTKVTGSIWIRKFIGEINPNYTTSDLAAEKEKIGNWIEQGDSYVDPQDPDIKSLVGVSISNDTYNSLPNESTINSNYKTIIEKLGTQLKTSNELVELTGIRFNTLPTRLTEMTSKGLIEVSGQADVEGVAKGGRGFASTWSLTSDGEAYIKQPHKATVKNKILGELLTGPKTPQDIASKLGKTAANIGKVLRRTRDKDNFVTDKAQGQNLYKVTQLGLESVT